MKNFGWGLVAGLMLGWCAQGDAADLRAQPLIAKAPPVVEAYNYWNGIYAGGYAGVGWDRGAGTASDPFGSVGFNVAPFGFTGGLYGGLGTTLGGNFYVGLEANGGIVTADGDIQNPGFIGNVNSKTRWLASVRGRFGFILAPNLLAYATGGYGWAGSEFTVTGTDGSQFSTKPVLGGLVAGAGVEYAFNRNWGLKLQYLHYFLGDANMSTTGIVSDGKNAFVVPIGADIKHSMGEVTVGVTYHFSP